MHFNSYFERRRFNKESKLLDHLQKADDIRFVSNNSLLFYQSLNLRGYFWNNLNLESNLHELQLFTSIRNIRLSKSGY